MDRIGAIGGPLLALLILYFFDNNIRLVFLFSVVPAVIALFFIKFVKETPFIKKGASADKQKNNLRNTPFLIFLLSNIIFNLGNSSNAFLILKAREEGLAIALIPVIWIVYNIFCSFSSPLFGTLYPIFHKLEKDGYLSSRKINVGGKIRKYYSITKKGSNVLKKSKAKAKELFDELFEKY